MQRLGRGLVWFLVGVFLSVLIVPAYGATQAAFTGYRESGSSYASGYTGGFSSSKAGAGGEFAAYLTSLALGGACGGTLSFSYAEIGGTSSYYPATNSAGGGTCASGGLNGTIGATADQCSSGFVFRTDTAMCTNVNDTAASGGGCNAGKDQMMILSPDSSGNAPIDADYGGCGFVLSQAKMMKVDGQLKIVGVYTSTGSAASGGSTASGSGSTTLQPSCAAGKITNLSSGVTTCIAGTETEPALSVTYGQNALGDPVTTTVKCIGDSCVETVATGGAAPTTAKGSAVTGETCGLPGKPACKMDETGTADSAGAGSAGTALKGSYDALKGQADSAAASGDMSALGVPMLTIPGDGSSGVANPLAGTHACVNPSIAMFGNSTALDVCAVTAPLKLILFWALNVIVAMYAWGAFSRRRTAES